jgi:hypothetical protein
VVAPQRLLVGGLGVGDLTQVPDDLAQPGWVQAAGRLQQHRLRRRHGPSGKILRTAGQRRGVRIAELAVREGLGGPWQEATMGARATRTRWWASGWPMRVR